MKKIQIKYTDRISGSECGWFSKKSSVDVTTDGFGYSDLMSDPSDEAYYVVDNDKVVGILVFYINKRVKSCWISHAFIDKEYRRKGMYVRMYKKLRARCIRKNCRSIAGGIKPENKAMIATAKKIGRELVGLRYAEDLRNNNKIK